MDVQTNTPRSYEPVLQEYIGVLLRGKWIVTGTIIVILVAAILYTKFSKPVYKASAMIMVSSRIGSSSIFLDVVVSAERNQAQNEQEILNSMVLAKDVTQKLLGRKYIDSARTVLIPIILPAEDEASNQSTASIEITTRRVSEAVDFEPVPETDVIKITARSAHPMEAALLANMFAEAAYDLNLRTSRAKSTMFREFLGDQLQKKGAALSATEDLLQGFMQVHGIVALDQETSTLINQMASLETQRDQAEINLEALKKTLSSYSEQLSGQEVDVARVMGEANDPYIRLLQDQLARLEVQKDVVISQNPGSTGKELYERKLREIDDQVASLRTKLKQRTTEFLQTVLPGTQVGTEQSDPAGYLKQIKQRILETQIDIQSLTARKQALVEAIDQYETQFSQIPVKSIELAKLQRARLSNERLFTTLQDKYNEAMITEQSQFGCIDIIDRALPPIQPYSPKMVLNILFGFLFGTTLGIAIVFVRERLNHRIQTPDDARRGGLSLIGTVMQAGNERTVVGASGTQISGLVTLDHPFSAAAESYRHLRTHLQFGKHPQPVRTILVTSSVPGEGKTTTVSNLATVFAQAGTSVLIIDADLRKPKLHTFFGLPREPGLTEYLNGTESLDAILRRTSVETLSLICCGTIPTNSTEIIGSGSMSKLLELARSRYGVIIIDSSPVLVGTEPTILSTMVDWVLLVVCAGETRIAELQHSSDLLTDVTGKTPGIILNKFNIQRAYGFSYGRSKEYYYYR